MEPLKTGGADTSQNTDKEDKPKLRAITQEQFDDLEAKYRHLYIIDVVFDEKERYQFIARRPSLEVIRAVNETKDASFKVADLMVNSMIVGGDDPAAVDGVVYSRMLECLTGIVRDGKKLFTKA